MKRDNNMNKGFMITVYQRRDTNISFTPERGAVWIAETVFASIPYIARSRSGAPNALARVLVEAGVADDLMRVYHEGLRGYFEWPSLRKAAARTFSEGASTPLRNLKYTPPPESTETVQGLRSIAA